MLRTAEEWLNIAQSQPDEMCTKWDVVHVSAFDLKQAINEARIEAIKECAESATAFSIGYDGHPQVDKNSILNLINQIK